MTSCTIKGREGKRRGEGEKRPHPQVLSLMSQVSSLKSLPLPASYSQVHPTSLVNPEDPTNLSKFLAPESMRGSGGILLDAQGKRFADELTTRSVLTDAIFAAGTPMPGAKKEDGSEEGVAPTVAYLVLNEEAADAFGTGVLGFYMSEREQPR